MSNSFSPLASYTIDILHILNVMLHRNIWVKVISQHSVLWIASGKSKFTIQSHRTWFFWQQQSKISALLSRQIEDTWGNHVRWDGVHRMLKKFNYGRKCFRTFHHFVVINIYAEQKSRIGIIIIRNYEWWIDHFLQLLVLYRGRCANLWGRLPCSPSVDFSKDRLFKAFDTPYPQLEIYWFIGISFR